MSKKNKKNKGGIVYSTKPNFVGPEEESGDTATPPPYLQDLRVMLDKKARGGKKVTLVTGFKGNEEDLKSLGKELKSKCGVGGTVKNGEILVQGDFREKILDMLKQKGYKSKKSGG